MSSAIEIEHLSKSYPKRNGSSVQALTIGLNFLGYIIWFYALTAIGNMAWRLYEEMQAGTMEQWYMRPAPVGLILLGRTLALPKRCPAPKASSCCGG